MLFIITVKTEGFGRPHHEWVANTESGGKQHYCTDALGVHHSFLLEADGDLPTIANDLQQRGFHVTRIEEAATLWPDPTVSRQQKEDAWTS